MSSSPWFVCIVLAACGSLPSATGGDPSSDTTSSQSMTGDGTDGATPTTSTATTVTTGDGPDATGTTGPVDPGDTTAVSSTGSTSSSTGTSGAAEPCGPPCDAPWVYEGMLQINADTDLASLRCLVEITKGLYTTSPGPSLPPELGNLRRVGGSIELGSSSVTSLAGLECLEEVGGTLYLTKMTKLADISALAGLRRLGGLWITQNDLISDLSLFDGVAGVREIFLSHMPGVLRLPVLGPDSELERLWIECCDAITDLDALSGVPGSSGTFRVDLVDNAALTSITGLADLWPATTINTIISLRSLPALTSLAGIDGVTGIDSVTGAYLTLRDLPLIDELEPLAGLEDFGTLDLDGMPKLTTLAPLAGLRSLQTLQLGACTENGGQGLDGLTDITAIEGIEALGSFHAARNAVLTSLPSFPALQSPLGFNRLIDNPSLPVADAVAFIDKHGGCAQPPGACNCLEDLPNP